MDLILTNRLFGEHFLHQAVGVHGEALKHRMPLFVSWPLEFRGDVFNANRFAIVPVEVDCPHRDQINDALKVILFADRQLHRDGIDLEFVSKLFHNPMEIGPGAVHLVDEGESRNLVPFHLSIDSHRLALDATHRAEHEHCAIKHTEAAFNLDSEVNVARSIDQVDGVVLPFNAGGSRGNRDTTLPLEIHVVHGCAVAIALHFLDAVDATGVEQNPLGERCLTGVDVG